MAWNPSIPQPGDIPAQSQALILQNFQYLNTFVQGQGNALLLNQQATAPTVTATQVGIYNLLSGGINNLMVKNGTGAAVNITTAGQAARGWCILPCGVKMTWGYISVPGGSSGSPGSVTYSFSAAAGFPGFTAIPYNIQVTGQNMNSGNGPLYAGNTSTAGDVTTSGVIIYNSGATTRPAFIFAVGV